MCIFFYIRTFIAKNHMPCLGIWECYGYKTDEKQVIINIKV